MMTDTSKILKSTSTHQYLEKYSHRTPLRLETARIYAAALVTNLEISTSICRTYQHTSNTVTSYT